MYLQRGPLAHGNLGKQLLIHKHARKHPAALHVYLPCTESQNHKACHRYDTHAVVHACTTITLVNLRPIRTSYNKQ